MATWQTPLCPFKIDFAPDKLDEIRLAVADGFYAVPRGGVEIGGVLFGEKREGQLSILDYRKIETEYLTGPSFRLSDQDLTGFQTLIAETKFHDRAIVPLGWFHSHTRSPIHLAEEDVNFHKRFFPEPWQIAMVLKPDNLGKVRAAYFFTTAAGSIQTDSAMDEFPVEPYFGAKSTGLETPEKSQVEDAGGIKKALPLSAATERDLFRIISKPPGISEKKKIMLFLLLLALLAAGGAGYWVAIHRH
jgi:proteasome lid subunit RPN8/RPN11